MTIIVTKFIINSPFPTSQEHETTQRIEIVLACEKRARARIHCEQLMEPARVGEVYRECMRNYAARLGAYASDGCCVYTPDALHPNMIFCTACGCHRNFHRKVPMSTSDTTTGSINIRGGTAGEILRARRRRRRTKFTAEQKARMAAFAAQIGWKVQKRDDRCGGQDEVSRFCEDVGITRQVFKIWIHNHKRTGAAAGTSSAGNTTAAGADRERSEGGGGSEGGEVEEEIKGSASMEEEN